jgi:mannan endo-1,4-beta-mannosidase
VFAVGLAKRHFVKKISFVFATVTVAILQLTVFPPTARAASGLHIVDGRLVEGSGSSFVMRGTNQMYTWFPGQVESFADVKSLGANALRVVLSGGRWPANGVDDVANVVNLCRSNKLICVLDDHDPSGYPGSQGDWTLDRAVDYWISVKGALVGQEDYILINIGNEPFNGPNTDDWLTATESAVQRLRNAGFSHTLVVDGPYSGQDVGFAMRDNAAAILNNDPLHDILFSIHMYGAFVTPTQVISYMESFQSRGLPLVVGEFGDNSDDPDLVVKSDANTIMAEADRRGIGYLGWCWSGNNATGPAPHLDQAVGFDPSQLTDWGQRLFNGPDGIRQSSKQATIYAP